jgi:GxxExxY protein
MDDFELTDKIIGCAFKVSNTLGTGFLEKVYENALAYELHRSNINFERQKKLQVHYEGIIVGEYVADLVVESSIVIELKAVKSLEENHYAQCINYLNATNFDLCLLMNFGTPKIEIRRVKNKKFYFANTTTDELWK